MATITKKEREKLERNKYIHKVTNKNIYYTSAFKRKAIEEFNNGKEPAEIFRNAGIDINIIFQYRTESYINDRVYAWSSEKNKVTTTKMHTLEKETTNDQPIPSKNHHILTATNPREEISWITINAKIMSHAENIISELKQIKDLKNTHEEYQSIAELTKKELIKSINEL